MPEGAFSVAAARNCQIVFHVQTTRFFACGLRMTVGRDLHSRQLFVAAVLSEVEAFRPASTTVRVVIHLRVSS